MDCVKFVEKRGSSEVARLSGLSKLSSVPTFRFYLINKKNIETKLSHLISKSFDHRASWVESTNIFNKSQK